MTLRQLKHRRKYVREYMRERRRKIMERFRVLGLSSNPRRYGLPLLVKRHNIVVPGKDARLFMNRGKGFGKSKREYKRIYDRMRRRHLIARGLSTNSKRWGLPPVKQTHKFCFPEHWTRLEKQRGRQRYHAAQNVAKGLTAVGTQRKNRHKMTYTEKSWRIFRETGELLAA